MFWDKFDRPKITSNSYGWNGFVKSAAMAFDDIKKKLNIGTIIFLGQTSTSYSSPISNVIIKKIILYNES